MKFPLKLYLLPGLLLAVCACAPWSLVTGKFTSSRDGFEIDLPGQWRKQNFADNLTLTKDGLALQRVIVGRFAIDKDAPHTKRKLSTRMTPQDASEVVVDDFRSNQEIADFELLESLPATVGSNPGFKLMYSYRTKQNLKESGIYYGTLSHDWLYFLFYEAPARHYFVRDLQTFEKIKQSFRITD